MFAAAFSMVEQILRDASGRFYGISSVCLRYFNAAGAMPDGSLGEAHDPETHLYPFHTEKTLLMGKTKLVFLAKTIIHQTAPVFAIMSMCLTWRMHIGCYRWLSENPGSHVFNLGSGQGFQ